MLRAALAARADAVYLGGKTGNARAFAGNFSDEELSKAVEACHLQDAKAYLTLNTLVKPNEMQEIVSLAGKAWAMGIDAVILQDLGLAYRLRHEIPDLPLHASTQMNVHSLEGVQELEKLGISRVILARETTLRELERMRDACTIEREIFIHGSLCVSHSGQCLLSGLIGGRSGNRGRCAQPCRKMWELQSPNGVWSARDTWLSLRDMNTASHMETWKQMDIASLKIEGRMKKPSYVYAAVRAYRALRDGEPVDDAWFDVSSRAFTSGFTLGDFGEKVLQRKSTPKGSAVGIVRNGKGKVCLVASQSIHKGDTLLVETRKGKTLTFTTTRSIAINQEYPLAGIQDAREGSEVRRVYSASVDEDRQNAEAKGGIRHPLTLHATIRNNQPIRLQAKSGVFEVTVEGEYPQKAQSAPLSRQGIDKQLVKVGNTSFAAPDLHVDYEEGLFVPVRSLNALRREALEALAERMARPRRTCPVLTIADVPAIEDRKIEPALALELDANEDAKGVSLEGVARIYTADFADLQHYRETWKRPVYFIQPPLLTEKNRLMWMRSVQEERPDGLLVRDPAGIRLAKLLELPFHAEYSLHVTNAWSDCLLRRTWGAEGVTVSPELSSDEAQMLGMPGDQEWFAFGPLPAMWLTHCPYAAQKGCRRPDGCASCLHREGALRDEEGAVYAWDRRYGVGRLYHSKCIDRVQEYAKLKQKPDRYRIVLRADANNPQIVERARTVLLSGEKAPALESYYWKTRGYTLGAWKEGVE